MTQKLAGKVAFITGAGSGMGRAIAKEFAAHGAQLALIDINAAALAETAAEIGAAALPMQGDISDGLEITRLVESAEAHFGRTDILVNCAGIHDQFVPLEETDDALWDRILSVNLKAAFRFTRAVLPGMRDRGYGNIINVASAAGFVGGGGGAAYTSSKHGLIGLTRQTAVENGKHGVRANALCPGAVMSNMTKAMLVPGSDAIKAAEATPIGRVGQPEEIARVALFLASEDSSFVVGAAYLVDGGHTTI
jgi:3-oxoacyl-[acyl-carrier protein] reductase